MRSIVFIILLLIGTRCRKEYSAVNEAPVANAGKDQVITIPETALLDGTASYDPGGGTIGSYQWQQISGPSQGNIINPGSDSTRVHDLVAGIYGFELRVTDQTGLKDADTVLVTVKNQNQNLPPVANAGPDQSLAAGSISGILNGNQSYDPDGTIVSYLWSKLSGPGLLSIVSPALAVTNFNNGSAGMFLVELKVTDNLGAIGRDTVSILISGDSCMDNRPVINVQLVPVNTLAPRAHMRAIAVGNKILFEGGELPPGGLSNIVNYYDVSTNTMGFATLTEALSGRTIGRIGNKVFIAGGMDYWGLPYSRVDVYDATTGSWTIAQLSVPRAFATAVAAGDKLIIAGGQNGSGMPGLTTVDIYDNSTNTWTTSSLSIARTDARGVAANGKAYISGGTNQGFGIEAPLESVEVYDPQTNTWSIINMTEKKARHAGIEKNGKIYWAGGKSDPVAGSQEFTMSRRVEIYDPLTQTQIINCLHKPNQFLDVVHNNENIIFFTGYNSNEQYFDIYNTTTQTWSIGKLPFPLKGASIVSVNNSIYVAGGVSGSVFQDKVWKLVW